MLFYSTAQVLPRPPPPAAAPVAAFGAGGGGEGLPADGPQRGEGEEGAGGVEALPEERGWISIGRCGGSK